MKIDNLRRYVTLRDSLVREKSQLEQRLREIDTALGQSSSFSTPTSSANRRGRPARGSVSLRDAVLQVTGRRPMTKEEILDAVKTLGYRFSTSNPLNSLGVILYGKNPRFKNTSGLFSPAGGTVRAGANPPNASTRPAGAFARKRRKMSAAARERIAAAQRARWAKSRAAK